MRHLPCSLLRWYETGVVEREPGLPLSLLGDLLWLLLVGGRDRLGEAEIIPSEMVLCWERWLEGRVL